MWRGRPVALDMRMPLSAAVAKGGSWMWGDVWGGVAGGHVPGGAGGEGWRGANEEEGGAPAAHSGRTRRGPGGAPKKPPRRNRAPQEDVDEKGGAHGGVLFGY